MQQICRATEIFYPIRGVSLKIKYQTHKQMKRRNFLKTTSYSLGAAASLNCLVSTQGFAEETSEEELGQPFNCNTLTTVTAIYQYSFGHAQASDYFDSAEAAESAGEVWWQENKPEQPLPNPLPNPISGLFPSFAEPSISEDDEIVFGQCNEAIIITNPSIGEPSIISVPIQIFAESGPITLGYYFVVTVVTTQTSCWWDPRVPANSI